MTAPKGYYKQLISDSNIRIARGLMITIVENQNSNGYLRPGELYFKS